MGCCQNLGGKNNSKNHTSDTKCVESVELSANAAWQIPHFLFQKGVHKNSLISDSAPEAQTARARPTTTMSELTAHQLTNSFRGRPGEGSLGA